MTIRICAIAAAVFLSGCEAATTPEANPPAAAAAAEPADLKPAGPAESLAASEGEHPEAYVVRLTHLTENEGHLYSTAGGDPAINGLYTFYAAPISPVDGVRVFQLGDFNEWSLLYERPGQIALEVSRSFIDDAGEVQTVQEALLLDLPKPGEASLQISKAERPN